MYKDGFISWLKANGKTLREVNDKFLYAYIPFNTEYSIQLENTKNKYCKVRIEIDGKSIGSDLILAPFEKTKLDCFINKLEGNYKFKFIEKIDEIKEFRGETPLDGIIRIEFQYGEKKSKPITISHPPLDPYNPYDPPCWPYARKTSNPHDPYPFIWMSSGDSSGSIFDENEMTYSCCNSDNISLTSLNTEGITVEGNDSEQKFTEFKDELEFENEINVITYKLKGIINEQPVKTVLSTKDKIQCKNCGLKVINNPNNKFCSRCGSRLINK